MQTGNNQHRDLRFLCSVMSGPQEDQKLKFKMGTRIIWRNCHPLSMVVADCWLKSSVGDG